MEAIEKQELKDEYGNYCKWGKWKLGGKPSTHNVPGYINNNLSIASSNIQHRPLNQQPHLSNPKWASSAITLTVIFCVSTKIEILGDSHFVIIYIKIIHEFHIWWFVIA